MAVARPASRAKKAKNRRDGKPANSTASRAKKTKSRKA